MPQSKARPIVFAYLSLLFSINCQNNTWGKFWDVNASTIAVDPLAACKAAVAGDALAMICVPANTTGFSRGGGAPLVGATPIHTVASITGFAIGKYEIQKGEWSTVLTWANINGYSNLSTGTGSTNQHPIGTLNWRDTIVWCNAASERNGLTPVYYDDAAFTIVRKDANNGAIDFTPGGRDNPYVKWGANGYRLATEAEWEYAARYIDGTTFLRGDAPTGWIDSNSNGLVDAAEYDFSVVVTGGAIAAVGTRAANVLGIHDMNGNMGEWVWDAYFSGYGAGGSPHTDADSQGPAYAGGNRALRGHAFGDGSSTYVASAGRGAQSSPSAAGAERGLRVVRRP